MSLEERDRIAAQLRARQGPPPSDPGERREAFVRFAAAFWPDAPPAPDPIELGPGLSGRLLNPDARTLLIFFHGGAFAVGSSETHAPWAAEIARDADCAVLLPDYRLAPEHPFPAANEDALAVLDWIETSDWPFARTALGGDSAGGNLALGALQARLSENRPVPAALWLLSPYLDLAHTGESMRTRAAGDPFVNPEQRPWAYIGRAEPADPRLSPLYGPVEGLPPTLIQVGSDEALFDDSLRLARRMWDAGLACVFQEWVGQFHDWPLFAPQLEEGRWANAQVALFLRRTLAAAP